MTDIEFYSDMWVELYDKHGADESKIIDAARQSYDKSSKDYSDARNKGLLKRLINDGHSVPFEHISLTFKYEVPIFVDRQLRTHRWSSVSEISGRYSILSPAFYIPSDDSWRVQTGKPMDYKYEILDDEERLRIIKNDYKFSIFTAWKAYQRLLDAGVAKEIARCVLPLSLYTKGMLTLNLRSVSNFLHLRTDEHAQYEIREMAGKVEAIVKEHYPVFHELWDELGRKAI